MLPDGAPDRVLFSCGGRELRFVDVLVGMDAVGELDPWLDELEARLAAVQAAPPPDAEQKAALAAWRKTRGLISADETRAWLGAHDLPLPALREHLARQLVRPAAEARVAADGALWAEAVGSGVLDRWMWQIGQRVAVQTAFERGELAGAAEEDPGPTLARTRGWSAHEAWLCAAERTWRAALGPRLTDTLLRADLDAEPLAFVRMVVRRLPLTTEGAAAEARLCVMHDGEPITAVARRAAAPCEEVDQLVQDFPAAAQARLLSAAPGELVGPLIERDRHVMYEVVSKHPGSLGDPVARARLVQRRTATAYADLVEANIRWNAWRPAP